MAPHVCVILVNWNGKADTLACLSSLMAEGYPSDRCHIIVVDNGSSDNSTTEISAAFPSVELLATGRNLGFTGGNNVGIDRALTLGADYIFLLNNDTTIEPGTIRALVDSAASNSHWGLLTPVIHYFDSPGDPWFAGSKMDLRRGIAVHDNATIPSPTQSPSPIPWASGCAMLLPARILRQLRGFDDRFFLNWEDVDLSLRVRSLGFEIALVPAGRVHHKVGRSFATTFGAGSYYYTRNQLLLLRLHLQQGRYRAYAHAYFKQFRSALRAIVKRQPKAWRSLFVILKAAFDHLTNRYGPVNGNGVLFPPK